MANLRKGSKLWRSFRLLRTSLRPKFWSMYAPVGCLWGPCLQRLTTNWTPLLNYFEDEVANAGSTKKVQGTDNRLKAYTIPKVGKPAASTSTSTSTPTFTSTPTSTSKKPGLMRSLEKEKDEPPAKKTKTAAAAAPESRLECVYRNLLDTKHLAFCVFGPTIRAHQWWLDKGGERRATKSI